MSPYSKKTLSHGDVGDKEEFLIMAPVLCESKKTELSTNKQVSMHSFLYSAQCGRDVTSSCHWNFLKGWTVICCEIFVQCVRKWCCD